MLYKLGNVEPELVGGGHFIASTAAVIGRVSMGANSSVWFSAVVRGDMEDIIIGDNTNIQDAAVLHADPGYKLVLGDGVTIGHQATVHGCMVGDNTLIGINAVVLNGAKIGRDCLIGANALVTENMEIPDGSLVLGSPAKIVSTLSEDARLKLGLSATSYAEKARLFAEELEAIV